MSTTAVPPVVTAYGVVPPIQTEVAMLAHRHITLSYAILCVLSLSLALAAFGGWLGYKSYERALQSAEAAEAKYEQREKVYQQQLTDLSTQLAKDEQDRALASQHEAQLEAQITARSTAPLPPAVQTGLKPDATAQETAGALGAVFSTPQIPIVPTVEPDGKVAVSATQAREMASQEVAGQRAEADLRDTRLLYSLEQTKTASLQSDVNTCQSTLSKANDTLKSANDTITAYKKAAVKTKWQKIWGGMKEYGGFVLGVVVGKKL